jgi:zinc carboxypeptidase/carboxypeptidase M14-like protein
MLGRVEARSETEFLCHLSGQADHEGRNRQVSWYFFRLDGARGREVTVTLTDLRGEYNYKPGGIPITDQSPPVVSTDGKTWRPLTTMTFDKAKEQATFHVTPETDSLWIAHIEPFTASRLDRLLAEIRGHPDLTDTVIGKSVEGRDLHLLTIATPKSAESRVVWLMCRQHAWESGTSFVGEGAIRFLLSKEAEHLRKQVTFKILPMMDPDGCAKGGVRFNRNGYDVNRNWDTADPGDPASRRLMPEICAAKQALVGASLFLTLHNQETDEWLSGSVKHKDLGERFFARLVEKTTFNPSRKGPRDPITKYDAGRASVYEYLEIERGLPAFILEQGIAFSSKLGHLPTSKDRLEFGAQLARVMAEVVLER